MSDYYADGRPHWDDQFRETEGEKRDRWRDTTAKRRQQVEAWNAAHKIGDPVYVTLDSGQIKETVTTSEAQMLSGHTAVIWLEGISGCYILSRVRPRPDVSGKPETPK
jgi:hypothetical protein